MTEFARAEESQLLRPSAASDGDFLASRPQFDPWAGPEPAQRQRSSAVRPSRSAIRSNMVTQAHAVARSHGLTRLPANEVEGGINALPESARRTFDNGFFMTEQLKTMGQLRGRDSRSLSPSTNLAFGDSSRISHNDSKALVQASRIVEDPIAEDTHGEGEDAREFQRNVAAFRQQGADRRFGEWTAQSRSDRAARASKFRWLSPSTWNMFSNFGWAKKAHARRQIADLEKSLGGKAPKQGSWRSGRSRPGATDANLFGNSAYSMTPQEYRAWGKAIPSATRYENATTAKDQQAGRTGIMEAATAEGVDGGELGRLALGAAVKSAEEKSADNARLQRAIDRDPAGAFSYAPGQVVGGHALLDAPSKGEDTPDVIKDVFGMGGVAASPAQDDASDPASDDDSSDAASTEPAPAAFQLRRADRIAM